MISLCPYRVTFHVESICTQKRIKVAGCQTTTKHPQLAEADMGDQPCRVQKQADVVLVMKVCG